MSIDSKAWFFRHKPVNINELILDTEEHKILINKWYEEETIEGNLLLFGPPGLGKTSTAELLINKIIKDEKDLLIVQDKSVGFIRDFVLPFVTSRKPVKSKKKIVYIEEMDRMKYDAFNELKTNLMEKFQHSTIFIGCTNYLNKIPDPIRDRFTYKFNMSKKNINDLSLRLKEILNKEEAIFDEDKLSDYLIKNNNVSIREILNQFNKSYYKNNKRINFDDLNSCNSIEETIINIVLNISKIMLDKEKDPKSKKMCFIYPDTSIISKEYKDMCHMIHNNYDINYEYIFDRLISEIWFIPIKNILAKYSDELDFKKYPHIHFLGCYYDIMKILFEVQF